MKRGLVVLVVLGVLLRALVLVAHDVPRGDVVLDVGVARSLAEGEGFGSGFERGFPKLVGEGPLPPQDRADQHPPLWPLVGALGGLLGAPFLGLKLGSWLLGLILLGLVGRVTARLIEPLHDAPAHMPGLAMALVAINWLMIDAAGNGSLYTAQAVLVLLLVESLAARRATTRVVAAGLVSGALLLLNHQCAVLLPVGPLVLLLGARPGGRLAALRDGAGVLVIALVLLSYWWLRNAAVFGSPFHSVNPLYFLYRAGVEPLLAEEGLRLVLRFPHGLTPALMAQACLGFLKPNALYLLSTGLFVLPGVGAVAVASLPAFARLAWRERDRRLLALLLTLLVLAAVSALWPATKLRYLVPLVPLVVLLGVRVLASRRALPWEDAGALLLGLLWPAALWLTRDDVQAESLDARPERWLNLLWGGLLFLALPLFLRYRAPGAPRGLMVMSLGASLLLALVLLGGAPHTAYHSSALTPDFFGKHVELERAEEGRALLRLREAALRHGARRVAGPVELLSWPEPALVEITRGLDPELLERALLPLIREHAVDHVILLRSDAPALLSLGGESWLGGRLRRVSLDDDDGSAFEGGWLFEVRR